MEIFRCKAQELRIVAQDCLKSAGLRCYKAAMDKLVRVFASFEAMKAAEYEYWQSRPVHERMAAVSELSSAFYTMKDPTHNVSRLQRTVAVLQRPQR